MREFNHKRLNIFTHITTTRHTKMMQVLGDRRRLFLFALLSADGPPQQHLVCCCGELPCEARAIPYAYTAGPTTSVCQRDDYCIEQSSKHMGLRSDFVFKIQTFFCLFFLSENVPSRAYCDSEMCDDCSRFLCGPFWITVTLNSLVRQRCLWVVVVLCLINFFCHVIPCRQCPHWILFFHHDI